MSKKFCERDYEKNKAFMGFTQDPDQDGQDQDGQDQDQDQDQDHKREVKGQPTMKKASNQRVSIEFINSKSISDKAYVFEIALEKLTHKTSDLFDEFVIAKKHAQIDGKRVIMPLWVAQQLRDKALEAMKSESQNNEEVKDF